MSKNSKWRSDSSETIRLFRSHSEQVSNWMCSCTLRWLRVHIPTVIEIFKNLNLLISLSETLSELRGKALETRFEKTAWKIQTNKFRWKVANIIIRDSLNDGQMAIEWGPLVQCAISSTIGSVFSHILFVCWSFNRPNQYNHYNLSTGTNDWIWNGIWISRFDRVKIE